MVFHYLLHHCVHLRELQVEKPTGTQRRKHRLSTLPVQRQDQAVSTEAKVENSEARVKKGFETQDRFSA